MNDWIDLNALWKIIIVGLLAGAGLPVVFAVGIRALALPSGRHPVTATPRYRVRGGSTLGLVVGAVCFAVVLAAIGMGIYLIVAA